jgi:hypothetical protein
MVRASQNEQKAKPLELGAQLMCRWRDNEVKPCEVLERQQNEDTGDWEYCAPAPQWTERTLPPPPPRPAPPRRSGANVGPCAIVRRHSLRGDESAHGRVGQLGSVRPRFGDRCGG